MSITLEIFGDEFTNVAGIKATDDSNNVLAFYHAVDGNNIEYGLTDGTIPKVGIAKVGSAHVWGDGLSMMIFGSGQIGTGRVV
jgi:hypothetical protein